MSHLVHSTGNTSLHVTGLAEGTSEAQLTVVFSGYASLKSVKIRRVRTRHVAQVTFGTATDAENALRQKDGTLVRGSALCVQPFSPPAKGSNHTASAATGASTGASAAVAEGPSEKSAEEIAADSTFADALRYGLSGEKARLLIQEASRGGHRIAAAWAQLKGIDVPKEPKEAYATLCELAAEEPPATALQGVCLLEGEGVEMDELEGVTLLEEAVACGDGYGAYKLAVWLSRRPASAGQSGRVVVLLEGSAGYGIVDAQVMLGDCLYWGRGVEKDEERAVQLWEKAALEGFVEAQLRLQHCKRNGFVVNEVLVGDPSRSVPLFLEEIVSLRRYVGWSGVNPVVDGAKLLTLQLFYPTYDSALVLTGGPNYHRTDPDAIVNLRKAAETSDVPSIYVAGLCYRRGWSGFERDKARAAQLFARGCALGSADCMFELGRMLVLGEVGVGDHFFGLQMLSEAVARGSVEAEELLVLLTFGVGGGWDNGSLVDDEKPGGPVAVLKLRRSRLVLDESVDVTPFQTPERSADACYELGWAFWMGRCTPMSSEPAWVSALEEWRRAADGGSVKAKVCLARCYICGFELDEMGVFERVAVELLREAAAEGSMAARGALQTAYWLVDKVVEVPKDLVREMAAGGAMYVQAKYRKLFNHFSGKGLHWMAEALVLTSSSNAVGGGASAPPGAQALSCDGEELCEECVEGWRAFDVTTGGADWLRGLRQWRAAAEKGHAASAAAVGVCYEFGICVSPDMTLARRYYERAAGGGHLGSKLRLAMGAATLGDQDTLAFPVGVVDASRRGSDDILLSFLRGAWDLMLRNRLHRVDTKASSRFLDAAQMGHTASQLLYASIFAFSFALPSPTLRSAWMLCVEYGWMCDLDPERAVAYYEENSEGSEYCRYRLGLCRIAGRGCEQDAVEGAALVLQSGHDVSVVDPCLLRAGRVRLVERAGSGCFSSGTRAAEGADVVEVVVPPFSKSAASVIAPFVATTPSLGHVLKAKECILRALRAGVARDAADGESTALLVASVLYNHTDVLGLFLDWGVGLHCECDSLHAAVMHAIHLKRVSALQVFVSKGWRLGQDAGLLAASVESGDDDIVACVAGTLTLDDVSKFLEETSAVVSAEEFLSSRMAVDERSEGVKEYAALLRLRGVLHHAHWEAEAWSALDESESSLGALHTTMEALQQHCDAEGGGGDGVDSEAQLMREARDDARRVFVAAGEVLLGQCDRDLDVRRQQRRAQLDECISAVNELEVDGGGSDDDGDGDGEDSDLCEKKYTLCHESVTELVDELLQLFKKWRCDAEAQVKGRWEECRCAAAALEALMTRGAGRGNGSEGGTAAASRAVSAFSAWRQACGVAAARCRVSHKRYCADLEHAHADLMPTAELRRGVKRLKCRLVQLARAADEWGRRVSGVRVAVGDHKPWVGVSEPPVFAEFEATFRELRRAKMTLEMMKTKQKYGDGADVPTGEELRVQGDLVSRLGTAVRRMSTNAVYLIATHYPERGQLLKPRHALADVYASGRLMSRATLDDFEEVRTLSVAGRDGRNTVRVMKRNAAGCGGGGDGGLVVVKEIIVRGKGDEGRLEFARSVKHLYKARHRCVADVRSAFEDGGNGYIEMPYYEGGDLVEWMKEARRDPLVLRRVAHEVAQGLAHLHRVGIVHRDVKPTNVLLDSHKDDAHAVVADFDTAITSDAALSATITSRRTIVGGGTVAGGAVGTLVYMAPELFDDELPPGVAQSTALDVFSFGVTLLVMGNGGVVPDRPNGKDAPPIPAGMDPTLAALLTKMLAVNAADRPSMAEVILDSYFVSGGGAADLRDCCICGVRDGFDVRFEGAVCDAAEPHACCQGCIEHYLDSLCEVENLDTSVHKVVGGGTALECFAGAASCGGKVPIKQLARVLSSLYYDKVERVRAHAMDSKMAVEIEKRVAEEKARLEKEGEVGRYARHIQDKIFTLLCPHCDCAFLDFEGCLALSHPCGAGGRRRWFCGLCLDRCGEGTSQSSHAHVMSCRYNPLKRFYDEGGVWEKVQRERKQKLLLEYLAGIPSHYVEAVKAKVMPSAKACGVIIEG